MTKQIFLAICALLLISLLGSQGSASVWKPLQSTENAVELSSSDAKVLLVAGGKRIAPKPKATPEPRSAPKAKAPVRKPPKAQRSASGRALPQRVKRATLPKQTQQLQKLQRKPAVSAAARKLHRSTRSAPRLATGKTLTSQRIESVKSQLRSKSSVQIRRSKATASLSNNARKALINRTPKRPRSVRHYSGISLPSKKTELLEKLKGMGLKSQPTTVKKGKTKGQINGIRFQFRDGSSVRVMNPSGRNGHRAAFSKGGNAIDPKTGKAPQPPNGLNRKQRNLYIRSRTHMILSE